MSALARSDGLIPSSLGGSNAMLSCWGAVGDERGGVRTGLDGLFTMVLLDEVEIVRGACAQTTRSQEAM